MCKTSTVVETVLDLVKNARGPSVTVPIRDSWCAPLECLLPSWTAALCTPKCVWVGAAGVLVTLMDSCAPYAYIRMCGGDETSLIFWLLLRSVTIYRQISNVDTQVSGSGKVVPSGRRRLYA